MENNLIIIKIERLKKKLNNNWEDSQSVKLVFTNNTLPQMVKVNFMKYKVRPFIAQPMQCYKCQLIGHTSKSCRAKVRCMLCGDNHPKSQCESEKRYCVNCKGNHAANSKQCYAIQQAQEIERMKSLHNMDYSTARKELSKINSSNFPSLISQPTQSTMNTNSYITPTQTFASALMKGNSDNQTFTQNNIVNSHTEVSVKILRNAETQTEQQVTNKTQQIDQDFFIKLRDFMLDILNTNFSRESKHAKLSLADSAIKNNFGIDLRSENTQEKIQTTLVEPEKEDDTKVEDRKRKRGKNSNRQKNKNNTDLESTISTAEEDVISDAETIWQTVEKKQIRRSTRGQQNQNSKKQQASKIPRKQ